MIEIVVTLLTKKKERNKMMSQKDFSNTAKHLLFPTGEEIKAAITGEGEITNSYLTEEEIAEERAELRKSYGVENYTETEIKYLVKALDRITKCRH